MITNSASPIAVSRSPLAVLLIFWVMIMPAGCINQDAREFGTLATMPCEYREEYRDHSTLLFLDRTSNLSDQDLTRWQHGVRALLVDPSVAGRVELVDFVESRHLIGPSRSYCYPGVPGSDPIQPIPRFDNEESVGWLRKLFNLEPKPPSLSTEIIVEANQARLEVRKALADFPTQERRPPTASSDIVRPIQIVLVDRCRQARECRLFIFSDLVDSTVKRQIQNLRTAEAQSLGRMAGDGVAGANREWLSRVRLTFVVWGFGRDEVGSNRQLPEVLERNLRAYWGAFLTSVCTSAGAGSGVFVGLDAPNRLPSGC